MEIGLILIPVDGFQQHERSMAAIPANFWHASLPVIIKLFGGK